jgi:hypothetical protein
MPTVRSFTKINPRLAIDPLRPDGFHDGLLATRPLHRLHQTRALTSTRISGYSEPNSA